MLRKQKNLKRFTFINSNVCNTNNSNLNNTTDFNGNNYSNNVLTILKPSFPSTLIIDDLINVKNNNISNKPKSLPNAFIAYRMALMKEYRIKNCKLPSVGKISKIARNSWNMEPKHVKDFYESLVKDAKSTYKKNNIQIVLDKHMDYTKQVSDVTCNAEKQSEKTNPIHGSVVSVENNNNNVSFSTTNISLVNSLPDIPHEMNSTLNDREYIRVLEQIIDHLLKN
jgi:hypothetical protein